MGKIDLHTILDSSAFATDKIKELYSCMYATIFDKKAENINYVQFSLAQWMLILPLPQNSVAPKEHPVLHQKSIQQASSKFRKGSWGEARNVCRMWDYVYVYINVQYFSFLHKFLILFVYRNTISVFK